MLILQTSSFLLLSLAQVPIIYSTIVGQNKVSFRMETVTILLFVVIQGLAELIMAGLFYKLVTKAPKEQPVEEVNSSTIDSHASLQDEDDSSSEGESEDEDADFVFRAVERGGSVRATGMQQAILKSMTARRAQRLTVRF